MERDSAEPIERLLDEARPRLRKAYIAVHGVEHADDAAAEAVAWGWEHQDRLRNLDNPIGYLYRVGLTRSIDRHRAQRESVGIDHLPEPAVVGVPHIEPGLIPALKALPEKQRTAVWLVHGCQWTHAETAAAMNVSRSTVGSHIERAVHSLRRALEVTTHG